MRPARRADWPVYRSCGQPTGAGAVTTSDRVTNRLTENSKSAAVWLAMPQGIVCFITKNS
jgi:hypothetical protein